MNSTSVHNTLAPKSSVEQALTVEKEDGRSRNNKLYDGSSEKAAAISKVVEQGRMELMTAYHKGQVLGGNIEEIIKRTNAFIDARIAAGEVPTVEGLAVSLGISRRTLQRWIAGGVADVPAETVRFLRLVREYFSDVSAVAAIGGNIPAIPWIFYAKNHYEYADRVELAVAPNDPLGNRQSSDEIGKRYALGVGGDFDDTETRNDFESGDGDENG